MMRRRLSTQEFAMMAYDKHSNTWASSDGTEVTATKLGNDSWEVHTKSGFGGII